MSDLSFAIFTRNADDIREFATGEVIFAQGDEGDLMYAVKSGAVTLTVDGQVVDTILAASVFGEMALIGQRRR